MSTLMAIAGLTVMMAQQPSAPPASQDSSVLVGATVGGGKTWDDEGTIGNGLSSGGSVEWRFDPRMSVIFRLERLGHERQTSGDLLVFSGRTIFATGEFQYRFRPSGATPYVTGGYGAALYSGQLTSRFGTIVNTNRSSRSGVLVGAGGVEVPIGRRVFVTPELRLYICQPTEDFAPWMAIRRALNVGWRF
jgi:opacity protein-like surface antigen